LGALVAENSTARFFVPKVAKRPSGEFRDVVPSKTETRKRNKHEFWVKRVDWVHSLRKIQLQVFCSKSG
jgi:hypothetical protein